MKPNTRSMARIALVAALACQLSHSALAETAVDKRQVHQSQRITAGTASGQLTLAEQNRLNAQEARIATGEAQAASDGMVTRREERKLNARQDNASRHIAHARHDRQKLPK